jgi:UDP-N-acetylglucosamine enolpyruvyl transferase/adenylate cyclase class IV
MQTEIEAKWLDINIDEIRQRLRTLGAELVTPQRTMRRSNWDYPNRSLAKKGGWVRVRDEGDKITLSYKQTNEDSLHGTQEVNVSIGDFDAACSFLNAIGLKQKSYQETRRESWVLDGVEIELDEWPWVPPFIELEAPSEVDLKSVAGKLQLDMPQAHYGSVEKAYQAVYDISMDELVFAEITFSDVPDWLEKKRLQKAKDSPMSQVSGIVRRIKAQSKRTIRITGPSEIVGELQVQGSKNAANKLVGVMVALPGQYHITNFPMLLDPLELLAIIESMGAVVLVDSAAHTVDVDTRSMRYVPISHELTRSTTGAFSIAGAILGRFGRLEIGRPGGDEIGARPIDLHLQGMRALGAKLTVDGDLVRGSLGVTPGDVAESFPTPVTGPSCNYIFTVAASGGSATLNNVESHADMHTMYELMRTAGVDVRQVNASVSIDATSYVPSDKLVEFRCSVDRNDAFTCLAIGALSHGGVVVKGIDTEDMRSGIETLASLGVTLEPRAESELFVRAANSSDIAEEARTIVTGVSGTFHTDWAPLLCVVLSQLPGDFRIIETRFSDRVRQSEILKEMGADICISGGDAPDGVEVQFIRMGLTDGRYITDFRNGPVQLSAAKVGVGYDVRACAAACLAAAIASGTSELTDMVALYRGYDQFLDRLRSVAIDAHSE